MIRFLSKVFLQRALGWVPFGPALYHRHRSRLIRARSAFSGNVADKHRTALEHLRLLREVAGIGPAEIACHLEIGSGWLPVIPLTFHRHGMTRQILTDVERLLCEDAVSDVARVLEYIDVDAQMRQPGFPSIVRLADAGLSYRAPVRCPLPAASGEVDLVTCTQVLIYPPASEIRVLHEDVARCLRPGGLYLATIRLDDLYALSDPALPRFNFLRYSRATWSRWFCNRFAPLNRLRPVEHARLLDGLPFERLLWRVEGGRPDDLEQLARSRPHPEFAHMSTEDLSATHLTFLLRRL